MGGSISAPMTMPTTYAAPTMPTYSAPMPMPTYSAPTMPTYSAPMPAPMPMPTYSTAAPVTTAPTTGLFSGISSYFGGSAPVTGGSITAPISGGSIVVPGGSLSAPVNVPMSNAFSG